MTTPKIWADEMAADVEAAREQANRAFLTGEGAPADVEQEPCVACSLSLLRHRLALEREFRQRLRWSVEALRDRLLGTGDERAVGALLMADEVLREMDRIKHEVLGTVEP